SAVTIADVISGNFNLSKSGAGALTLSAANTFGGVGESFTLNAGTLNIGNAAALGDASNTFVINGGTIDNTSGSALTINNYTQTWSGSFTFTGSNSLNLGTGGVTLNANPTITTTAGTLTVDGVIADGSGNSLTKAGTGILALGGTNTYTGPTTINGGKLIVNGSLAGGAVSVNGGAALGGIGTIGGAVTVAGGTTAPTRGTIDLVNGSTGTLTLNSTLTLGGLSAGQFSTMNFEIGSGGTFDSLAISGSLILNSGGVVLNITGLSGFGTGTYNLFTFASLTGSSSNFSLGTTPGGGFTYTLGFSGTTEFLTVGTPTALYWKGDQGN